MADSTKISVVHEDDEKPEKVVSIPTSDDGGVLPDMPVLPVDAAMQEVEKSETKAAEAQAVGGQEASDDAMPFPVFRGSKNKTEPAPAAQPAPKAQPEEPTQPSAEDTAVKKQADTPNNEEQPSAGPQIIKKKAKIITVENHEPQADEPAETKPETKPTIEPQEAAKVEEAPAAEKEEQKPEPHVSSKVKLKPLSEIKDQPKKDTEPDNSDVSLDTSIKEEKADGKSPTVAELAKRGKPSSTSTDLSDDMSLETPKEQTQAAFNPGGGPASFGGSDSSSFRINSKNLKKAPKVQKHHKRRGNTTGWLIAVVLLLLAVAGAGYVFMQRGGLSSLM